MWFFVNQTHRSDPHHRTLLPRHLPLTAHLHHYLIHPHQILVQMHHPRHCHRLQMQDRSRLR